MISFSVTSEADPRSQILSTDFVSLTCNVKLSAAAPKPVQASPYEDVVRFLRARREGCSQR